MQVEYSPKWLREYEAQAKPKVLAVYGLVLWCLVAGTTSVDIQNWHKDIPWFPTIFQQTEGTVPFRINVLTQLVWGWWYQDVLASFEVGWIENCCYSFCMLLFCFYPEATFILLPGAAWRKWIMITRDEALEGSEIPWQARNPILLVKCGCILNPFLVCLFMNSGIKNPHSLGSFLRQRKIYGTISTRLFYWWRYKFMILCFSSNRSEVVLQSPSGSVGRSSWLLILPNGFHFCCCKVW